MRPLKEIEPNESAVPIDHPVQPGWLADGYAIFHPETGRHVAVLAERSEYPKDVLQTLIADVALAGTIVLSNRMKHEAESRGILGIDASHGHLLRAYQEFAGRPEHIGRFIHLFGGVAGRCFEQAGLHPAVVKIGLDLGGTRQAGRWAGTGPIDDMADALPEKLVAIDERVAVRTFGKSRAMNKNYTVQPLHYIVDGRYDPGFASALVRRRRGVADIYLPDRYPMHVVKEAWSVEYLDGIDESEAAIIRKDFRTYEDYQANTQKKVRKDTPAAGAAGRVFEEAIRTKQDNPTAVIPISAHYYVVMHGPNSKASIIKPR